MNDSILERETERQRLLLQEARKALEQQKAQLRQGGAGNSTAQAIEPAMVQAPFEPAGSLDASSPASSESITQSSAESVDYSDRIRRIPDMRFALLPLDEQQEGAGWSKPFSLLKADMEPWLSFLRGYKGSRLFLDHAFASHGEKEGRDPELRMDAAIQALFELKGFDTKAILEPVVQINGPVAYYDPHDPESASVPRNEANDIHESLLAKAVEKGKEMGSHLYDALLGEGHVNLTEAWENVYGRKPTVNELYQMLTTGRAKPATDLRSQPLDIDADRYQPQAALIVEESVPMAPAETEGRVDEPRAQQGGGQLEDSPVQEDPHVSEDSPVQEEPYMRNEPHMRDELRVQEVQPQQQEPQRQKTPRQGMIRAIGNKLESRLLTVVAKKFKIHDRRELRFHLFHLGVCCAALVAYWAVMRIMN